MAVLRDDMAAYDIAATAHSSPFTARCRTQDAAVRFTQPRTVFKAHYTAASGKDRFDHCRGKSLIYQTYDARPNTPEKHGKKGAPGSGDTHQAPYATLVELPETHNQAAEHRSPMTTHVLHQPPPDSTPINSGTFDPAVYAANRVANIKMKEEGALKSFVGNGNILAHPINGAAST